MRRQRPCGTLRFVGGFIGDRGHASRRCLSLAQFGLANRLQKAVFQGPREAPVERSVDLASLCGFCHHSRVGDRHFFHGESTTTFIESLHPAITIAPPHEKGSVSRCCSSFLLVGTLGNRLFQTGVLRTERVSAWSANSQASRPSRRWQDRGAPRRNLKMAISLGRDGLYDIRDAVTNAAIATSTLSHLIFASAGALGEFLNPFQPAPRTEQHEQLLELPIKRAHLDSFFINGGYLASKLTSLGLFLDRKPQFAEPLHVPVCQRSKLRVGRIVQIVVDLIDAHTVAPTQSLALLAVQMCVVFRVILFEGKFLCVSPEVGPLRRLCPTTSVFLDLLGKRGLFWQDGNGRTGFARRDLRCRFQVEEFKSW